MVLCLYKILKNKRDSNMDRNTTIALENTNLDCQAQSSRELNKEQRATFFPKTKSAS